MTKKTTAATPPVPSAPAPSPASAAARFLPVSRRGPVPPWRDFQSPDHTSTRGLGYVPRREEIQAVNAALQLRRPLLVTGKPGIGKSTLAYAVARQLGLGDVIVWPITSRSALQQGLYHYDAIARLQDASLAASARPFKTKSAPPPAAPDIGRYVRLGPLGTAFITSTEERPAVLLIDEIDKSDIDLPNDLLHFFEEGCFLIPELARLGEKITVQVGLHDRADTAPVEGGRVRCAGFPFVVLTSNDERDFPPAFLRRCLRVDLPQPTPEELADIVASRLKIRPKDQPDLDRLVNLFSQLRDDGKHLLSTDQLLNAAHLVLKGGNSVGDDELRRLVLRSLT